MHEGGEEAAKEAKSSVAKATRPVENEGGEKATKEAKSSEVRLI